MKEFLEKYSDLLLYIGIGVVVLALFFVVLGVLVIRPHKMKKKCSVVDNKYQFSHALLIGQDANNVKRLEVISRTNLLYVETHTKFLREFKEIKEREDNDAMNAVNEMKDLLADKDYKEFKNAYIHAVGVVDTFVTRVDVFTKELSKVIKPEEDCRQSSLEYKNKLRTIKQDYYAKESELSILNESFAAVFDHIDDLFAKFEEFVESAQYDEANKLLPDISEMLHDLVVKLNELPSICALITNIVPTKIHEIENVYKGFVEEHYPLHNLFVMQTIQSMNLGLEKCTEKIQTFDTDEVRETLEGYLTELDQLLVKFDDEKAARAEFEEKNEGVYARQSALEKRFITLRNTIPEVSDYFVVNKEHTDQIADLQKDVNKLGALKRSLDTFVHSSTKQPYSLLMTKMNELDDVCGTIETKINEFDHYIESLNADAQEAYNLVFNTYEKIKTAEQYLRLMNIDKINAKYAPELDSLYELLNSINIDLTTAPINVDEVNNKVRQLSELSNRLLDEGEIYQDYNMMVLAESAIVIANKDRVHLADIDQILSQAEVFFENGDFAKANETAKTALNKIKLANGK